MNKLLLIFYLGSLIGCVATKKYRHQDILEQRIDGNGRIVLKKYRQLISHPSHDKIATITQEYDTLGRVIKEYGIDNPFNGDRKYLIQKLYKGTVLFVRNKIMWQIKDTIFSNTNFVKGQFSTDFVLFEETIYPDSNRKIKNITISLTPRNGSVFYGQFNETIPDSDHSWTNNYYEFEIDKEDIHFDQTGRLNLDKIKHL